MKKIFTLISVALCAISVNAQTPESFVAIKSDNTPIDGLSTKAADGSKEDIIFTTSTTNVQFRGVASPTPRDIETSDETLSYTNETWPDWNPAEFKRAGKHRNIWYWDNGVQKVIADYYYVQGSGNPVFGFASEAVYTEGTFAGKIRPLYRTTDIYDPETATSIPEKGAFWEVKPSVAGLFRVAIFLGSGSAPGRKLYFVSSKTSKPLPTTDYKIEGYINNCENQDGSPTWIPSMQVNSDYTIGNSEYAESYKDGELRGVIDQRTQDHFMWFVFQAEANVAYKFFSPDTQPGFYGYEFTPGATIDNYTPTDPTAIKGVIVASEQNVNAPIYNLAGQKVDKSFKGIVIQNGKKFFSK